MCFRETIDQFLKTIELYNFVPNDRSLKVYMHLKLYIFNTNLWY
jgi:hypothetical protein